ncbi:MAG: hypothetical protein ACLQSR_06920 [Limisphaerales bacterium]
MFVRFVAACMLGISITEVALSFAELRYRHMPINMFYEFFWAAVFVAGFVILIKARAVAEWVSDLLE